MKKNSNIKYVLIVVIGIALLGGLMNLSKSDETSVAETNIVNNIKYNNVYNSTSVKDNDIDNDIKTNTIKNSKVDYESSENNSSNSTVEKSVKSENTNNKTSATSKSSTSSTNKNNTTTTASPSSYTSTSTNDKNSKTVWIGNTGTKYHRESCGTLKGKGHEITLKEAIAEGREPCKVCKP